MTSEMPRDGNPRDAQRAKHDRLVEIGVQPYAYRWDRTHTAESVKAGFDKLSADATPLALAGRLMSRREHGKTQFGHIQDGTGRIQLYLRRDALGDEAFDRLALLDIGDIVGVRGEAFKTRTGEITIMVREIVLLAKSLRPLPEKFHGLKDVETRYRQRYLDLIVNEESRRVFLARTRLTGLIRRFLDARGYVEVETPTLQPLYGGAAAEPFRTRYNVLEQEMFLRISDELYLKRLIVGGLERVYELCKDFRNEGLDRTHNPEFTQVELYQAYADYTDMMALVEDLFREACVELNGTTKTAFQGQELDFGRPWQRLRWTEALAAKLETDPLALSEPMLRKVADRFGIEAGPEIGRVKLLDKLFEELVQNHVTEPTFVIDHPLVTCPLAKPHRADPALVERFEPVCCGIELGNAFSELNDPLEQRRRFEAQLERHDEFATLDEDFIAALEHGMPPTGGLGLGVDRMVMVLTDTPSIRDVILFPQLRPETG
ncbi:MAG: lysine--tRNA ligase [bacterium]